MIDENNNRFFYFLNEENPNGFSHCDGVNDLAWPLRPVLNRLLSTIGLCHIGQFYDTENKEFIKKEILDDLSIKRLLQYDNYKKAHDIAFDNAESECFFEILNNICVDIISRKEDLNIFQNKILYSNYLLKTICFYISENVDMINENSIHKIHKIHEFINNNMEILPYYPYSSFQYLSPISIVNNDYVKIGALIKEVANGSYLAKTACWIENQANIIRQCSSSIFVDSKITFTGKSPKASRKEFIKITENLSPETNLLQKNPMKILVLCSEGSTQYSHDTYGSKVMAAMKQGALIITEEEFWKAVDLY